MNVTAYWCCSPPSPVCGGASWRRSDVDATARTVRVTRQLNERDRGEFSFGPPKSEAGVRIVAIPELITPDLAARIMTYARPGDEDVPDPGITRALPPLWPAARHPASVS